MSHNSKDAGRVTLPIETGIDEKVRELVTRLGADAVRNSDGTELPEIARELGVKVYSTYFPARGDQEWALANPDSRPHFYVLSKRVPAPAAAEPLRIHVIDGWFTQQIEPDTEVDVTRWWQVIDRTTGTELTPDQWRLEGQGHAAVVVIEEPTPHHVYTVGFLAKQIWDSTQMYNYITNDWESEGRAKSIGYDVRHPATWEHMKSSLARWLEENPHVDVVRFTTFFYHFTLMFGTDGREAYVDWFGYSGSISVPAMEEFEQQTGIRLTAEDFVDEGYYNSPFREPRESFRQWIAYQHGVITRKAGELVEIVHQAGREAMMFLGDNWMGIEPYGPLFHQTKLDSVVGSVGSAATCRMISDIPYVKVHEGRFLPYFFPDVFNPEGDPLTEANENWVAARRAILRKPLERIGYGGYLSLALEHPEFVARVEEITDEFRQIHEYMEDGPALSASFRVGVLNAWGKLRTWQTHMVAHALPYRAVEPYLGVLESLAGLPVDVEFLSFEDIREGVPEEIGVLINAGGAGTAFSGGSAWDDPELQASVRAFVARGGGFIGVGEPTASARDGAVFQLSDVLGVDRELGWSLSTDRYPVRDSEHPLVAADCGDLAQPGRFGPSPLDVVPLGSDTSVIADDGGMVRLSATSRGGGRAVYISGLPYTHENSRLLHRAIFWSAGREEELTDLGLANDARVEVTRFESGTLVTNLSTESVTTEVTGPWGTREITLDPMGNDWIS
ncbi:MAG: 1,3-beta-galactosyl-N-acetylhexosamine phosphorylase [bacterium]|nr:1,3-beta-galactosyl-N-acetylhexosamine phosphorylase [bacterium]